MYINIQNNPQIMKREVLDKHFQYSSEDSLKHLLRMQPCVVHVMRIRDSEYIWNMYISTFISMHFLFTARHTHPQPFFAYMHVNFNLLLHNKLH